MKKSLPHLTALAAVILNGVALAQPVPLAPPAEVRAEGAAAHTVPSALGSDLTQVVPPLSANAVDPASAGDQLLRQVAFQLARRATVTAKLRHQVAIYGQQLYGIGNYWQQGSGEELKVRLELQIAGQEAQLLQVCNSRFIWTDRTLPTGRSVSRIDLRQLRADPALIGPNLNEIKPGQANWSVLQSELTAYTGGLPTLLSALAENFIFMSPQAMRLAIAPPVASEPMSVPVFAVVGHWKPERLAGLLSQTQAAALGGTQPDSHATSPRVSLPDRLPEEVLLLVGQADMFPYRIEYRRLETPQIASNGGSPIPYQLSASPLVVLELSDVVYDTAIEPGQFDYAPGNADWTDQTTAILQRLRQQRQTQVATKPQPDRPVQANR